MRTLEQSHRPRTFHHWLLAGSVLVGTCLGAAACQRGAGADTIKVSHGEIVVPAAVGALGNTFDSAYSMGEAILEAIEMGDRDRLMSYGVTEAEWYYLVWPGLPASRPDRGVSWDYAWRDLRQKSTNSARRTISSHQGHRYRLLRVEFAGETSDYGTYRVHRDARCVVQDAAGEIVRLNLFGSVIEMGGHFKAFSFVVD